MRGSRGERTVSQREGRIQCPGPKDGCRGPSSPSSWSAGPGAQAGSSWARPWAPDAWSLVLTSPRPGRPEWSLGVAVSPSPAGHGGRISRSGSEGCWAAAAGPQGQMESLPSRHSCRGLGMLLQRVATDKATGSQKLVTSGGIRAASLHPRQKFHRSANTPSRTPGCRNALSAVVVRGGPCVCSPGTNL